MHYQRHARERDHFSRRKQPHAVKRVKERTNMLFDEVRRAITSGKARLVGKARWERDLYEISNGEGGFIYAVWEAKNWCIKTVLTRRMVERGRGVVLENPLSPVIDQAAA